MFKFSEVAKVKTHKWQEKMNAKAPAEDHRCTDI